MHELTSLELKVTVAVVNAENPIREAARIVGAAMGAVARLHGDQASAAILYALADVTATHRSGDQ